MMTELFLEYGIWGVFASAFISATIFPLASEVVVVAAIALGVNPWYVFVAAGVGNTLGGMTSYLLGRIFDFEKVVRWIRIKPEKVQKFYPLVHKYDFYLASLGFMPLIGDAVMIALGVLRSNVWGVLLFSTLFKFLRYWLIIWTQVRFF